MKMNISLPVEIDIPDCVIEEIRNKAIDELKDAIVQKFTEYDKKGYVDHTNAGIKIKVAEIAEQLKGGGVNE